MQEEVENRTLTLVVSGTKSVSYTHLDVYKRQHYNSEQMHNTILLLIRNWSKKRGYTQ